MKRSLVAAACAAAFGFVAASAYAAPSVTLYGLIDEYVAVNNDSGNVSSALSSGGSSGSYWGLKGEEDLPIWGGTKVAFKLESGFLADDGTYAQSFAGNTSRLFHREAWVGLQNRHFGQISFGRQYTPHFLAWAMTDSNGLSLGTAASPFFFPGAGGTMGDAQNDLVRANNSIFWATPSYNGFSGMAYMALGEETGADGKKSSTSGNIYNVALQYNNGKAHVIGSVLYKKLGASAAIPAAGIIEHARGSEIYYELAGSYDLGFTKPSFQFEWKNGEDKEWSQDFWIVQLGTKTPMFGGALNTTATYYKNRTLSKSDAYGFGARFDYNLSKRTMLYAGVSVLVQEDNAQFAIEAGPDSAYHFPTTAPGNDTQQVFMGIRHTF